MKDASGAIRKQTWHYPSRNECMFCHSRAAGFVLGLTTAQMNRSPGAKLLEEWIRQLPATANLR